MIDWLKLLRPLQWTKNLLLLFPPFLSGALFHEGMLSRAIIPIAAFCCAASSGYVFNDLRDLNQDIHHPSKRHRPLASGRLNKTAAKVLFLMLLGLSLALAWQLSSVFLMYLVLYFLVSVAYTTLFKNWAILDIFFISFGFVLRLYGGGEAFSVYISDWLFLSVFLLAVFLSFGKRYSERHNLGEVAVVHRRTLAEYPPGFLESGLYLSGSTVLVTYAFYAINTPLLVYTFPLCMFGLLRYLLRIKSGGGGDPTEALVKDPMLCMTGIAWLLLVGWIIYL
jgi:4-hydroxybenzoate polyprenyltransferase